MNKVKRLASFSSDFKLIIACTIISVVIFLIDSAIPLGVAGGVPYIVVILITLWAKNKNITITFGLICNLLTILGYYSSPPGGELWKVIINRGLALFAIWTSVILGMQRQKIQEQREQVYLEREKAYSDIRILKGLLPICASCKKIRDDKGYWRQIETYIREHSEAEFSHSLCPVCAEKLYPDLLNKQ